MQQPTKTGSPPKDPTVRLDPVGFAASTAIVAAGVMLLLGLFGRIGIYTGAVEMMERWHLFFRPTLVGTLAAMAEAAVITFPLAWILAWLYNVLARR